jgi:hypothetical protein
VTEVTGSMARFFDQSALPFGLTRRSTASDSTASAWPCTSGMTLNDP